MQHILQQEHKINQIQPLIIYVDNSRLESSYTSPLINGLSEHDAQFLTINNIVHQKTKFQKSKGKD
jgi:hypothetical protein